MTSNLIITTLANGGGSSASWLLPAMVGLCFFGGLGILSLAGPKQQAMTRGAAMLISLLVFALNLALAIAFDWSDAATVQLATSWHWVESFGVSYGFGIDAISFWLILLTTFLMPLTILGTWNDAKHRAREFYGWLLLLEMALIGVFAATDLILFYVFFELTLIPLFFLIGIFGSGNRQFAAYKFFLYTLTGSLLTFAGVLYVAWFNAAQSGQWTFNIHQLTVAASTGMTPTQQGWVLAALMAGFAVKVPLFPVHTWLPLAHTEAPTAGSVVLAGVLLKLGTYGLLRFALPMAPAAVVAYAPLVGVFAVAAILYAALVCWVQSDMKKLVAYSSVSHMGFCVLGLFALNAAGVGGSVIYMINHGLSTGALFLCVGMVYNRYHTREMDALGGLGKRMPIWGTFMVFFALASVGLPGLNGFVGEFLTLLGTFQATDVLGVRFAAAAALGLIFAAIYILYMVGKVVFGPVKEPPEYAGKVSDLSRGEIAALAPLAAACLVLGLYPAPVLHSIEPSIDQLTRPARLVMESNRSPLADRVAATGVEHEEGVRQ